MKLRVGSTCREHADQKHRTQERAPRPAVFHCDLSRLTFRQLAPSQNCKCVLSERKAPAVSAVQAAPIEPILKHPFTQQLHAYWTECRGERRAPERADIDPAAIRRILGDSLVLSCDAGDVARFRVAGTKLCALLGRELHGDPFSSIWDADSAPSIGDIVRIVADEGIGVVAGAWP